MIKNYLFFGDVEEWDVIMLVFVLKFLYVLVLSCLSYYGRRIGNVIYRLKEVRNEVIVYVSKVYFF